MKRSILILIAMMTVITFSFAFASGTFTPPKSAPENMQQTVTSEMKAVEKGSKAKGHVTLDCYKDGKDMLEIRFENLKPASVYTVWLVNEKPKMGMEGAGRPPYDFKTDTEGKARFIGKLNTCPMGKWEKLVVVLHPDGDPKNMKEKVEVLMTTIK